MMLVVKQILVIFLKIWAFSMPRRKFGVGDVVFYRDIKTSKTGIGGIGIVVSEEHAKQIYKIRHPDNCLVTTILKESAKQNPIFFVDLQDNTDIGWMPKDKLYLATKAYQILYGKKNV